MLLTRAKQKLGVKGKERGERLGKDATSSSNKTQRRGHCPESKTKIHAQRYIDLYTYKIFKIHKIHNLNIQNLKLQM